MGEEYLQNRKEALLAKVGDTTLNIEDAIEQLAEVNLALGSSSGGIVDISTLATEATSTAINGKLPALSSGRIPVSLPETNLTGDWRDLTTNTVIPAGSVQIYLKVILGDVTINGLTYSTGEYINLESCYPYKHPEINIVIPAGKSVRLVRGY